MSQGAWWWGFIDCKWRRFIQRGATLCKVFGERIAENGVPTAKTIFFCQILQIVIEPTTKEVPHTNRVLRAQRMATQIHCSSNGSYQTRQAIDALSHTVIGVVRPTAPNQMDTCRAVNHHSRNYPARPCVNQSTYLNPRTQAHIL